MKKTHISINIIYLIVLYALLLLPDISLAEAGTTGYTFLSLGVGSRPVSMGEAFVAVADDANALFWNPAGLGQIENPELNMTHLEWIDEVKQENFIWIMPLGNSNVFGSGVNYLHTHMISNRGNPDIEENFTFSDLAVTFGYGKKVQERLLTGISIKFIREAISIDSLSSLAIAADTGMIAKLGENLSFGMAVQNLGVSLSGLKDEKDRLPITLRTGIGYSTSVKSIIFALDIEKPIDDDFYFHSGVEFSQQVFFNGILSERIGYTQGIDLEGNPFGMLSGLRAGIGFMTNKGLQLDYAFQPFTEDIGYTHRISLGIQFFR